MVMHYFSRESNGLLPPPHVKRNGYYIIRITLQVTLMSVRSEAEGTNGVTSRVMSMMQYPLRLTWGGGSNITLSLSTYGTTT